MKSKFPAF
jgi:hypothetical protein